MYFLPINTTIFAAGISIVLPSIIFHIGQISGERKEITMALYTFTLFSGSSVGPYIGTKIMFTYVVPIIFSILKAFYEWGKSEDFAHYCSCYDILLYPAVHFYEQLSERKKS